jgi:DNA repair protein RadC
MKHLSPRDRPREKLRCHGAAALGDNELLAIVVGSGCRGRDALTVANDLLTRGGGAHGLARSSPMDLARVRGVGPARAARVVAALELGRRTLATAPPARAQVLHPRDAAAFLMPSFGARAVEQLGVVLLDSRHRVLRTAIVAVGGLNHTSVEPRDVFREATIGGAAAVLVFHNHPSGDPSPSADDVELTRRLAAAGALLGIDLVDHLVLGDARYCSLKETGLL